MVKFHYPFKPYIKTQSWGNPNPLYNQLGFSHHNGEDARIGKTNWDGSIVTEYPVYCPVEGFKVSQVAYYPDGGGNQIGLISKKKMDIGGVSCYVSLLLCHAKKILVPEGYEPAVGELLMIADNTGFSTGLHTHIGMYRLNDSFQKIDLNEMTGSYNPALFWSKEYAVDQASLATLLKSNLRYYKYVFGF